MSYNPEPHSHINLSNYATKKDFIALKAEVDKLSTNELINVPVCLNDLKRKKQMIQAFVS